MAEDIARLPASALLARYRDGSLSPVEAAQAALSRIEALNDRLNAFVTVDADGALAAARKSEARWRRGEPVGHLDGVPITIKDLILIKGWSLRRGSRTTVLPAVAEEDAPATARLKEHGAVLLGTTTTPEFGWKGVTDSPATGITRNPWNPEKTPGGSSGGAAAAAATGMGALHVGTDGGGSIRIPAGFTGIFGLKPSGGRVPAYPPSPFGSMAHLGPLTRTVADAALMLTVLAEPDARDWYALPYDGRDYRQGLEDGVGGLRIAFSPTLGGRRVEPEIARLVAATAQEFRALGAEVEEVDPGLPDWEEPFRALWYASMAHFLEPFDETQRALLDPGLRRIADKGAEVPLFDYMAGEKLRAVMGRVMNRFHRHWDLLLTPALPIPAFDAGRDAPAGDDGEDWCGWTPFSYPFNMTRQPAASVPCGFTSEGLPAALQIVGPAFADALVLRAARAYEQRHPFRMPEL